MKEIMQQHSPHLTCINQWAVSLFATSRNAYSWKILTLPSTIFWWWNEQPENVIPKKLALFLTTVKGGADKSLARRTSRWPRTELIVSLESGVRSHADLRGYLVTEAERKHVRRRARFLHHRDASCHQFFFARRRRKFTQFWQQR